MNEYIRANLARWDELAALHPSVAAYGLESFKAGGTKLNALDLAEVGDVRGRSLLHLQCHFGLDTLSWAREGAEVTGVDFSGQAITTARALADELAIPARFVQSSIEALPDNLDGQFDVVYTSRGALCWLRDIARWAAVVAHFLRPGGTFYVADTHPLFYMYDYDRAQSAADLCIAYGYFHRDEPDCFDEEASYADPSAKLKATTEYVWNHTLGDIVSALIDQGLRIVFLHEFPYGYWRFSPSAERGADGFWRLPGEDRVPLMFSLKAISSR